MKKIKIILSFIMLGLIINSCNNDDNNASYPYSVRLTDAPGPYDEVNVDIQGVEVIGEDGKTVVLNVKKGIFNLLEFSNGVDTLLATDSLEISSVKQIRLILGANNTVVLDGVSYPLRTPSAEQSGLKLKVNQTLQEGILYTVLLDFDANKSVVKLGNGEYQLKPVIRTIEKAISGSIKGKITPIGKMAVVEATSATAVSYTSNVNENGDFLVMGLSPGTYTITITPALPSLPVTKTNIVVTAGITTDIGAFIIL
ncbi:DUF4382 domain-containing protein [Flavobacterium xueshanense]|uniref:DUF4382 domain-containing protein n=1 Tax=Flavobacterium xueshanense TaxID=935223 RepID=A0A1I2IB71_9FLAO|nr:DUF4382 domain-containing protein [Flavobacterium xueshanense]SFF39609.1 protein of unknown function [Flavobacterium xueshanense]